VTSLVVLPVMYRFSARAAERWPARRLVPARAVRAIASARRRGR